MLAKVRGEFVKMAVRLFPREYQQNMLRSRVVGWLNANILTCNANVYCCVGDNKYTI